jgi:hypothetical protein
VVTRLLDVSLRDADVSREEMFSDRLFRADCSTRFNAAAASAPDFNPSCANPVTHSLCGYFAERQVSFTHIGAMFCCPRADCGSIMTADAITADANVAALAPKRTAVLTLPSLLIVYDALLP